MEIFPDRLARWGGGTGAGAGSGTWRGLRTEPNKIRKKAPDSISTPFLVQRDSSPPEITSDPWFRCYTEVTILPTLETHIWVPA